MKMKMASSRKGTGSLVKTVRFQGWNQDEPLAMHADTHVKGPCMRPGAEGTVGSPSPQVTAHTAPPSAVKTVTAADTRATFTRAARLRLETFRAN